MHPNYRLVVDRIRECFVVAYDVFNTKLENIEVRFALKGHRAACAVADYMPDGSIKYWLNFNSDFIMRDEESLSMVVDEIVPHEVAHLICFMNPGLGNDHDTGWQSVCTGLGGTGSRTYDAPSVYGRGNTYEYTTTAGHKKRLNERRHQLVQSGRGLTYKNNHGRVTRQCACMIVGVAGRTLTTPVKFVA